MNNIDSHHERILVIVEDLKLQDLIALILIGEGYEVKTYFSDKDALKDLSENTADLIIIDFLSPKIDGLNFCKSVRENILVRYIPIIVLIPKENPLSKMKAIYGGADDYIEKPFTSEELLARVKAALWRVNRYQDINPLTKLPGISTAIKELKKRIESKELFGVGLADLYNFKKFNDRYGFKRGDEVLKYTGLLMQRALTELGSPQDFLAHFGGDDFLFISSVDAIEDICKKIIKDFEEIIPSFYDEEDRERGYILVKNRKGEILQVPFLKIYIGVVTNENYEFTSSGQIFQIATELRDYAKKFEKSMYIKERRRTYPFY